MDIEGERDLPTVGDTIGGRYQIIQELGRGATGIVYEAAHDMTGKVVAIKWLRPSLAMSDTVTERFMREARAATAVDHPNVVAVFDAGRERGSLFLVMERLIGEPLSAFAHRGPHPAYSVVSTMMPAFRGVAAAHRHGIVHRDLKPDNVFLCAARPGWRGGAKVLDFGVSKLKQAGDGHELTRSGAFLGSPLYMAPEQVLDSRDVDARADVYSLGIILYELLSARVPFDAEAVHELFRKIMTDEPRPLRAHIPGIAPELESIVMSCITRDRAVRPPSVQALAESLEQFGRGVRFDEADRSSERSSDILLMDGASTRVVPAEQIWRDSVEPRDLIEVKTDPGARPTIPESVGDGPTVPRIAPTELRAIPDVDRLGRDVTRRSADERHRTDERQSPSVGSEVPTSASTPLSGPGERLSVAGLVVVCALLLLVIGYLVGRTF